MKGIFTLNKIEIVFEDRSLSKWTLPFNENHHKYMEFRGKLQENKIVFTISNNQIIIKGINPYANCYKVINMAKLAIKEGE